MFTTNEFERINNEFKEVNRSKQKQLKTIWGTLLGSVVLIVGILVFLFPDLLEDRDTVWILPTYGGVLFVVTLVGFIISNNYLSEKPFFEFLYPQVINKLNMSDGHNFEYTAFEKGGKEFNKRGGLFTGFASVKIKRHISGVSEQNHSFDIYDCTMITSSGNSQQTHFNGVYFILKKDINTTLQIRTNGSPKKKGIKYDKHKDIDDIKVYSEQGKTLMNIDHSYLNFMRKLRENENYNKVFLSIVNNEVHLGIWYKKHPARRHKSIDLNTLNQMIKYFQSEYKLINEIDNIDSF